MYPAPRTVGISICTGRAATRGRDAKGPRYTSKTTGYLAVRSHENVETRRETGVEEEREEREKEGEREREKETTGPALTQITDQFR